MPQMLKLHGSDPSPYKLVKRVSPWPSRKNDSYLSSIGLIDQGSKLQGKLKKSEYHRQMAENKVYPYDDMRCANNDLKAIMAGSGDTWSVCSKDRLRLIMG